MSRWNKASDTNSAGAFADPIPEDEVQPERTSRNTSMKALPLALAITALSSVVIAGASLAVAFHSQQRSNERLQELAAVMSSRPQQVLVQRDKHASTPHSRGEKRQKDSHAGAQAAGGSAAGAATQNGAAVAGGRKGNVAAPGGNAPAPTPPETVDVDDGSAEAPAADPSIPPATPEVLMNAGLSATDSSLTSEQRYYWAVDGAAAGPTLDQVAKIRAQAAPPPGMEQLGVGPLRFEVHDIVQDGDTATGTLVVIFPGNWGSWQYPNSGFQYVDGEWKLQKSAVCNFAQAAWIGCY